MEGNHSFGPLCFFIKNSVSTYFGEGLNSLKEQYLFGHANKLYPFESVIHSPIPTTFICVREFEKKILLSEVSQKYRKTKCLMHPIYLTYHVSLIKNHSFNLLYSCQTINECSITAQFNWRKNWSCFSSTQK